MQKTLILLGVVLAAGLIYWPILKIARRDIAARQRLGLSNGVLYTVLLIPLLGPFVYLVFRGYFRV